MRGLAKPCPHIIPVPHITRYEDRKVSGGSIVLGVFVGGSLGSMLRNLVDLRSPCNYAFC